jgi:hypothetical protein
MVGCSPNFEEGDSGGPGAEGPADGADGADGGTVTVSLHINELMASNGSLTLDPDDDEATPDWIELYNAGSVDVSLEGLTITDDLEVPDLHTLGDVTVPAGGFVVLLADGAPDRGPTHLGFQLSSEGEAVGLYGPDGAPLDRVTFADLGASQVAGRLPDGGTLSMLSGPTPGETNTTAEAL